MTDHTTAEPFEFRIGAYLARGVLGAALGVIGIGAVLVIAALFDSEHPTAWIVLGSCVSAFGLLGMVAFAVHRQQRDARLVIDHRGVHWIDPRDVGWSVAWHELSGVAVAVVRRASVGSSFWLDLIPADPDFEDRHPGVRDLRPLTDGYRVELGTWRHMWRAGQALEQFAPDIYQGFFEDDDLSK